MLQLLAGWALGRLRHLVEAAPCHEGVLLYIHASEAELYESLLGIEIYYSIIEAICFVLLVRHSQAQTIFNAGSIYGFLPQFWS